MANPQGPFKAVHNIQREELSEGVRPAGDNDGRREARPPGIGKGEEVSELPSWMGCRREG